MLYAVEKTNVFLRAPFAPRNGVSAAGLDYGTPPNGACQGVPLVQPEKAVSARRLCRRMEAPVSTSKVEYFSTHERKMIMNNLMKNTLRFVRDEEGATAIEYGLMAALIAVIIIPNVTAIGTALATTFGTVAGAV